LRGSNRTPADREWRIFDDRGRSALNVLSANDNLSAMDERDPGLDVLLDLDGLSIAADAGGKYWVKFVVKQVPPSPERPHGLSYSLTLHDETGARLVGFDNAHAGPASKTRRRRAAHDHRHRLSSMRAYEYRDAITLLEDFWAEVYAVLKERGARP
jgi:hypothetical protein